MGKIALFLCLSALSLTTGFGKRSARSNEADRVRISIEDCKQRGISLAKAVEYSRAREVLAGCHQDALAAGHGLLAAQVMANLGNLKLATHDYRGAMEDYLSARDAARTLGDRRLAGYLALNMSSLYYQLWSFPEARRKLDEAEQVLPPAERIALRVPLLLQRARLDARQGDLATASASFAEAIEAASQIADVPTQAQAWDLFGGELLEGGRLEEAEDAFTAAWRLRSLANPDALYLSSLRLAQLRVAQGRPGEALRWADRALSSARRTKPRIPLYLLSYARGKALARLGDFPAAHAELRRSLEWVREFRHAELPADSVRVHTGGGLNAVYSEYVQVASELYFRTRRGEYAVWALEAAEENRAAALRWSLSLDARLRDSLAPERGEALARLEAAHVRLFGHDAAEARREVEEARHALLELELRAPPDNRPRAARPFSAAELRRGLREREAVFSFHLHETRSLLWRVTSAGVDLYALAGAGTIRRDAAAFTSAVRESSPGAAEAGRHLYQRLFPDATAEDKSRWILVPDDVLFSTPFAALNLAPAGLPARYLIEERSLAILPSAAIALRPAESGGDGTMLAIGDPIYNTADPRWRDPRPWWRRWERGAPEVALSRLPGAAAEVSRCARQWGAARIMTGDGARGDRLRAALTGGPSVLHLATHLTPSPADARQVLLALSLRDDGEPELLGAESIRALRVVAPLVVMSGCSSASGQVTPGEGLRGLATAWLEAGARAVAASLWPAPDHSGELLETFYSRLREFPGGQWTGEIDTALRDAQIRMARSDRWTSRPNYWSGFSIYGH